MNKERLEKLCKFLDALLDEKFDFTAFVSGRNALTNCGTVCCAIGWCPVVFPESWTWTNRYGQLEVALSEQLKQFSAGPLDSFDMSTAFFGLSKDQNRRAFLPWEQSRKYYDLRAATEWKSRDEASAKEASAKEATNAGYCLSSARPQEVAANIRRIMEET